MRAFGIPLLSTGAITGFATHGVDLAQRASASPISVVGFQVVFAGGIPLAYPFFCVALGRLIAKFSQTKNDVHPCGICRLGLKVVPVHLFKCNSPTPVLVTFAHYIWNVEKVEVRDHSS